MPHPQTLDRCGRIRGALIENRSEDIGRCRRRRGLLSLPLAQLHLLPTRRSDSRTIDAFAICPGRA
jgi:hypothetical protein